MVADHKAVKVQNLFTNFKKSHLMFKLLWFATGMTAFVMNIASSWVRCGLNWSWCKGCDAIFDTPAIVLSMLWLNLAKLMWYVVVLLIYVVNCDMSLFTTLSMYLHDIWICHSCLALILIWLHIIRVQCTLFLFIALLVLISIARIEWHCILV
jgi:hypothetical protein